MNEYIFQVTSGLLVFITTLLAFVAIILAQTKRYRALKITVLLVGAFSLGHLAIAGLILAQFGWLQFVVLGTAIISFWFANMVHKDTKSAE